MDNWDNYVEFYAVEEQFPYEGNFYFRYGYYYYYYYCYCYCYYYFFFYSYWLLLLGGWVKSMMVFDFVGMQWTNNYILIIK